MYIQKTIRKAHYTCNAAALSAGTNLDCSAEHVEVASAIMVSATLLGNSEDLLRVYGAHVAAILQTLIGHLTEKGMRVLLPVMNVLLQVFPQIGPVLIQGPLTALLTNVLLGRESSIIIAGDSSPSAQLPLILAFQTKTRAQTIVS